MEPKQPDMTEVKVELDADQLEYIQENNIDLSAFIRDKIEKLREGDQD